MKKIVLLLPVLFFLISCKKSKNDLQPSIDPTFIKSSKTIDRVEPGTGKLVGEFELSVPDANVYASFHVSNTGTMTNNRNTFIVIRKKTDSSVMVSSTKVVLPYTFDFVALQKGTYYIQTFSDIPAGSTGTIAMKIDLEYTLDQNLSKWIRGVSGQIVHLAQASIPTLGWQELGGVIQDSVPIDVYQFTVTNNGSESISMLQFAFTVNINDVAADDTITAYDPAWIVDGADSTSRIKFSNGNNATVTSFPEGNNKIFVSYYTGSRQLGILPGQTVTIKLRLTFRGLDHDGNGLSIQLLSDANQLAPGYVNLVSTTSAVVKITTAQPAGSAGTVANLTWGKIGPSYSAIPGSSSGTHNNGYGIPALGTQNFHQ